MEVLEKGTIAISCNLAFYIPPHHLESIQTFLGTPNSDSDFRCLNSFRPLPIALQHRHTWDGYLLQKVARYLRGSAFSMKFRLNDTLDCTAERALERLERESCSRGYLTLSHSHHSQKYLPHTAKSLLQH